MGSIKIICDTDVLIDYFNTKNKRYLSTKSIIEDSIGIDNVIISVITKMELMMGSQNKTEVSKIEKNLHRFDVALIDTETSIEAMELFKRYRLSHGLEIPDCFIAATAKITQLQLFTYNTKDYKFIHKLKLYL